MRLLPKTSYPLEMEAVLIHFVPFGVCFLAVPSQWHLDPLTQGPKMLSVALTVSESLLCTGGSWRGKRRDGLHLILQLHI